MKVVISKIFLAFIFIAPVEGIAFAAETGHKEKIKDNSFLIEEAYNQEDGVVHHNQSYTVDNHKSWTYNFTQEWPVPKMKHQLSYTIPVFHNTEDSNSHYIATGLGDVSLNYRYQLVYRDPYAMAPRFTLILPTGNSSRGLGSGTVGMQVNIPFSLEIGDNFVTHWNAGATVTPKAKGVSGHKANVFHYNLGASAIWLALFNFNVMLEAAWTSIETIGDVGDTTRNNAFYLNPGLRMAMNFKCGLQVVPGISLPVGLGPSWHNYGILFYLSFEHPVF